MYIRDDVGAVSLIDIAQENNVKNDLIKCGEAQLNTQQLNTNHFHIYQNEQDHHSHIKWARCARDYTMKCG